MSAERIKQGGHRVRIALKFCGSCNPEIDLSSLSAELRRLIGNHENYELVPIDFPNIDILIILCGCRRACADRDEIKSSARHSLVVSGENLSGSAVPEKDIAARLVAELGTIAADFSD